MYDFMTVRRLSPALLLNENTENSDCSSYKKRLGFTFSSSTFCDEVSILVLYTFKPFLGAWVNDSLI